MSSESNLHALEVKDLGKCYQVYNSPRDRLVQSLIGERKILYSSFWALKDVSFTLPRGKTLGVVGRNGSGKSTLLQLVSKTLTPTTGSIWVNGRVAALLELGSGFNPEFSGIDNVYLNAALLGLSKKEVEQRLDAILGFADIGEHVYQPVKTYSSGMSLRLAFAVQAMLDPEILIIDEALAVGDERFQKKCYSHLEKLRENGTSILLVTHSCPTIVQQCDEAILLHKGSAKLLGKPKVVTTVYQRLNSGSEQTWSPKFDELAKRLDQEATSDLEDEQLIAVEATTIYDPNLTSQSTVIYPDRGGRIEKVDIVNTQGRHQNIIQQGSEFQIRIRSYFEQGLSNIRINCLITTSTGIRVSGQAWPVGNHFASEVKAEDELTLSFSFQALLSPGIYFITIGIKQKNSEKYIHRIVDCAVIRITSHPTRRTLGFVDLATKDPETVLPTSQDTDPKTALS